MPAEFTDEYLDELLGFTGNYRVDAGKASPHAGIRFPEGSKKIAFEIYVEFEGNYTQTREAIKRRKALGGRVPSMAALRTWATQDQWEVLRTMYNDGLREFLNASQDPTIKDAIKDDGTFFQILLKMRSSLVGEMIKPKSKLWPTKPTDALALLKHLEGSIDVYKMRVDSGGTDNLKTKSDDPSNPNNVLSFVKEKQAREGNDSPVTRSDLALDILKAERQM